MSLYGASGQNCHLTISAPSAGALGTGAYTVAVLYMPNLFGNSNMIWKAYEPANFSQRGLYCDGDMWMLSQQVDTNIPSFANPQNWYWLVASKGSANEPPRGHWATYAAAGGLNWTHLDALSSQAAASSINRICLGDEFDVPFNGNIACIAVFLQEMTDSEIESLFLRSSSSIISEGPQFFVQWPEADGIGSPFHDIAGSGVETIRTGTWNTSADPPSYDFSLGRSGKPKIWSGSAWNQHQSKTWNGSLWVPSKMNGGTAEGWVTSK